MRKLVLFLLAAVMLILPACQQVQLPENSTEPTDTSAVTTTPVETSVPPETTMSTEPTEDLLAAYNEWHDYMWSSEWENYLVFRYSGELPDRPGPAIDASSLKLNCLYAVDFNTAEVHQITEEACYIYEYSSEYIYYTLESEPTKVYRADHLGENKLLAYESEYGNVNEIQYYGTDANGQLILCEDHNRIISYDIPTGEIEVLVEAFFIEQSYFRPTSLWSDYIIQHISVTEIGANISWSGKLYEDDPESQHISGYDSYYYFIATDEHWDVETWKPRK